MLSPETAAQIARFAPARLSTEDAGFARRVVESAAPASPARAKALLFAASRLAIFARSVGLPLDPYVVLDNATIERFTSSHHAGSSPTRRTLRTNLRFLARTVLVDRSPEPVRLSRERAKAPYSDAEIASYLALADAQPTTLRRQRASALFCLGAGAGLVGAELRFVAGNDVVCRSGGVLVLVAGRRPRAVPVLLPFHDRLTAAAAFFGSRHLVSGANPDSHNVTNPLIRSLSGGRDLPRLETGRLRATYLVAMAEQIGLRAFMDAAGITCSQRLGDLVAGLLPRSEEEAVALLGALSR